jgi:hypothetical protein
MHRYGLGLPATRASHPHPAGTDIDVLFCNKIPELQTRAA